MNDDKILQLIMWKNAVDIFNNIDTNNLNEVIKSLRYYLLEYHESKKEKENYYYSFLLFYKFGITSNKFKNIVKSLELIKDENTDLIDILLEVSNNAQSRTIAERLKKANNIK